MKRIVAQTLQGSFGLLPHRLDCAAALAPGILTYETEAEGEVYLAVDQGVLVKAGMDVLVSVRNAIGGTDLDQLHEAVKREFLNWTSRRRAFARCWRRWRADSSAASWSFNMNEEHKATVASDETTFSRQVGAQAARKLKAQRSGHKERLVRPGHVGAGRLVGDDSDPDRRGARYLGRHSAIRAPYSWTLMLLLIGLIIGCLNAWHWVDSEYKEMQEDPDE